MWLSWNHTLLKLFNVIDHWCQILPDFIWNCRSITRNSRAKRKKLYANLMQIQYQEQIPLTNTTIPEEAGEKLQNSSIRFFPLGCRSTNRFSRFKRKFRNVFDISGFNFLRIRIVVLNS